MNQPHGSSVKGTHPIAGSHRLRMANTKASSRPTQKLGIARPSDENPVTSRSMGRPSKAPARLPRTSAMGTLKAVAISARESVTGRRSAIRVATGRPFWNELPRFPWTACWIHVTYCTRRG